MNKLVLIFGILFFSHSGYSQFQQSDLLGYWTSPVYDSVNHLQKAEQFYLTERDDGRGYQFLKGGKLIVRQNSGWCGTPPISYENVSGSWEFLDDNKLLLNYPYWGGQIRQVWQVKQVTSTQLTYQILNTEYLQKE